MSFVVPAGCVIKTDAAGVDKPDRVFGDFNAFVELFGSGTTPYHRRRRQTEVKSSGETLVTLEFPETAMISMRQAVLGLLEDIK